MSSSALLCCCRWRTSSQLDFPGYLAHLCSAKTLCPSPLALKMVKGHLVCRFLQLSLPNEPFGQPSATISPFLFERSASKSLFCFPLWQPRSA